MKFLLLLFMLCPLFSFGQQTPIFELNQKLGRGINMGNMLEAPSEQEWGNPFRDDYFLRIAELGFDHVRIPVRWDTPARGQMEAPFTLQPSFLRRVQQLVDMALDQELMVIINMHHHETLFQNPEANKARFLSQWMQIADYFKDYSENLLFEVMNEPHDQLTPALWNTYFAEALGEIRKTNPSRAVLMGTALFGGVDGITELDPPNDSNLIVTVHYYNPFQFTHQGAQWVGDQSQNWLGTKWHDLEYEREAIIQEIQPLISFSENRYIPIHMGEFGAYSRADMESRVRWTNFVARYFESIGFSWAYWEWSAGFGIFNPQTNQYVEPLVEALLHLPMEEPRIAYPIVVYQSNFNNSNDGWNLHTQQNASGILSRENGLLKIAVLQAGSEGWHVQLAKGGIKLKKDKLYRILFEGRADQNISLSYYIGKASAPYNSYSGYQSAQLTDEFKPYSVVFTMTESNDDHARFVFDLGTRTGNISIRNIKVEELNFVVTALSKESVETPKVYPNPVKDYLRIEQIGTGATIELYNLLGQNLLTETVSNDSFEIQMGNMKPGIYMLRLFNQNQWYHFRIIKDQ